MYTVYSLLAVLVASICQDLGMRHDASSAADLAQAEQKTKPNSNSCSWCWSGFAPSCHLSWHCNIFLKICVLCCMYFPFFFALQFLAFRHAYSEAIFPTLKLRSWLPILTSIPKTPKLVSLAIRWRLFQIKPIHPLHTYHWHLFNFGVEDSWKFVKL